MCAGNCLISVCKEEILKKLNTNKYRLKLIISFGKIMLNFGSDVINFSVENVFCFMYFFMLE